jgi:hypothetical protein
MQQELMSNSKFAERYNAFISKVVSQATKAAQGADGTTSGLPISLDAAEHAVEAGSIALTCLEKIRGDLKYKVLDYERSVHAFIAKAVLAKKVRLQPLSRFAHASHSMTWLFVTVRHSSRC